MPEPLVDHHVHFVATVAARLSLDLSAARSVAELLRGVAAAPSRGWLRAWGYEEWRLGEGRHPTGEELDGARADPVVLHHRTGHAAVLNSSALKAIGAERDHRDGLLVDRHDLLARVPRLDHGEMSEAASSVSREWAASGVGVFVDATHTNGAPELELLAAWAADGVILQAVTAMVGVGRLDQVPAFGESVGAVSVGHAKLMPRAGEPPAVAVAHAAGFPAAVHVVDVEGLESSLRAIGESPAPPGTADRIEHNALCLPEQVPRLALSGAAVVVNPSFLVQRRAKYEAELSTVELEWLIRLRSLVDAGITVRAGSDSPVAVSSPEEMVAAAMAHPFAPRERLDGAAARRLCRPMPRLG